LPPPSLENEEKKEITAQKQITNTETTFAIQIKDGIPTLTFEEPHKTPKNVTESRVKGWKIDILRRILCEVYGDKMTGMKDFKGFIVFTCQHKAVLAVCLSLHIF